MTTDHGGVAAELAVLTPVLVLCMLFVVFAGRLGQAKQDVTQAAAEAARSASLGRGAQMAGLTAIVSSNLRASGVDCRRLDVDTSGSERRPGGSVRVRVRCEVDLHGVAGLGLPRDRVVEAHAVEVVDTYRGGE
jgi:Flp pilus assembly protein TadG